MILLRVTYQFKNADELDVVTDCMEIVWTEGNRDRGSWGTRSVDLCTLGGVPHVLFLLSTCGRDICLCPMYFMFYFVLDFG
jgi:hypothetical protein